MTLVWGLPGTCTAASAVRAPLDAGRFVFLSLGSRGRDLEVRAEVGMLMSLLFAASSVRRPCSQQELPDGCYTWSNTSQRGHPDGQAYLNDSYYDPASLGGCKNVRHGAIFVVLDTISS